MSDTSGSFEEKLKRLTKEFELLLPKKLFQIEEVWKKYTSTKKPDKERLSEVKRLVHTLAGSGASFGFRDLSNKSRTLESRIAALSQSPPEKREGMIKEIGVRIRELHSNLQKSKAASTSDVPDAPQSKDNSKGGDSDHPSPVLWIGHQETQAAFFCEQLNLFDFDMVYAKPEDVARFFEDEGSPSALIMDAGPVEQDSQHAKGLLDLLEIAPEGTPIVLITPETEAFRFVMEAIKKGVSVCIPSPVSLADLVTKLDRLVRPEPELPFRLFVLDDDEFLLGQIQNILGKAGLEVRGCGDPETAVTMLKAFQPDLLLLDFHLPDYNGLEFARMLRQYDMFMHLPIVYLSAEQEVDHKLEALEAGGEDFLLKPIRFRYLYHSLLPRMQRGRQLRSFLKKDSLTGLPNHTEMQRVLNATLRELPDNTPLVFALLDIDHFQRLNEVHGHMVGDRVIETLARLLIHRLRHLGWIGRYGGEEFAIILPHFDEASAQKILDKVRNDFSQIRHLDEAGESFAASFSCGLAGYPEFGTPAELTEGADKALFQAKSMGRDQVLFIGHVTRPGAAIPRWHQFPDASPFDFDDGHFVDEEDMQIGPTDIDTIREDTVALDALPFDTSDEEELLFVDDEEPEADDIEAVTEEDFALADEFETRKNLLPEEEQIAAQDPFLALDAAVATGSFPVFVDDPESEIPTTDDSNEQPEVTIATQAPLVVVVDDEHHILELVSAFVKDRGYRVETASTGDEAFSKCLRNPPGLVLTDLLLFPGIHGFELCERIKKHPDLEATKVIVMTAVYKNYRYRLEAREAGADDFLEKPIDFDQLREALKKLIPLHAPAS
jgi:diguanylate cyclase (GGDEF)-like protein